MTGTDAATLGSAAIRTISFDDRMSVMRVAIRGTSTGAGCRDLGEFEATQNRCSDRLINVFVQCQKRVGEGLGVRR